MSKIILYANRNVGLLALSYLVARKFKVSVITEDANVKELAYDLMVPVIDFGDVKEFDLFLCVHGRKILSNEFLAKGVCVNVHPTSMNGHNPVARYIANNDTHSCIRAMYMTDKVDEGELIAIEQFETGICNSYADFYNISFVHYYKIISKVILRIL